MGAESRIGALRIAAYEASFRARFCVEDAAEPDNTEDNAVAAMVAAQRAHGDPIDPAGARRLIRALAAVGLLAFGKTDGTGAA